MIQVEGTTHSFIVKIWSEPPIEKGWSARWRGHITHVPGGERQYFQDLDEIRSFIQTYYQTEGVAPNLSSRLRYWFRWVRWWHLLL